MALDLTQFGLSEMLKCSVGVRQAARGAGSMEAAGNRVCRYLYDELSAPGVRRACALVRMYKVQRFGALPAELQRFAKRALKSAGTEFTPTDDLRCLTLLSTVGDEESWNHRHLSKGHQAIPLASAQMVQRAPMIAALFQQFGLEARDIVQPTSEVVRNLEGKTYGVFHVDEASGSPQIPAQAQFVDRYGIRSVVGFGGSLPGSDLFAVIMFTRVPVGAEAADRFRTIALDVKGVMLPHAASGQIFEHGAA